MLQHSFTRSLARNTTVALAMACLSRAAQAAIITQDRLISGSDADKNFMATFRFDKFSGPGILVSATLDWDVTATGSAVTFFCLAGGYECAPGTYTLSLGGGGDLADPSDSDLYETGFTNRDETQSDAAISTHIADSFTFGDLSALTGTGTVSSITVSAIYDGYLLQAPSFSRTGRVTLSYEISDVPVPAALPLMLGGLGVLAGVACRRSKRVTHAAI
jgi:hypothetical protein